MLRTLGLIALVGALGFMPVASAGWVGATTDTDTDCANEGVIVGVGSYECGGGPCANKGILVWVGSTCFHEGAIGACAGGKCTTPFGLGPTVSPLA